MASLSSRLPLPAAQSSVWIYAVDAHRPVLYGRWRVGNQMIVAELVPYRWSRDGPYRYAGQAEASTQTDLEGDAVQAEASTQTDLEGDAVADGRGAAGASTTGGDANADGQGAAATTGEHDDPYAGGQGELVASAAIGEHFDPYAGERGELVASPRTPTIASPTDTDDGEVEGEA